MPSFVFTDMSIRSLKSNSRTDFWDTKTPGFGIRVGLRSKTFIAKVHNRRITIGRYPDLSLAEARRKAHGAKSEDAPVERSKITFELAYEKFKEAHVRTKKPRTQKDYKRVLEKYFIPELSKTRLAKITFEKLTKITDNLTDTPSEQAHALAVARTFFKWCARPPRKYIDHSPLDGLQLTIGKSRKRTLTDRELVDVWNAAEEQGYPHGTVVQLLILTGQRRGEIAGLQRPWINGDEQTITLPDWTTKNNTEHTFPYGNIAMKVLENVPRRNSTDLLFPSRWAGDRPFSGWSKYKEEMIDGVARWTLHDLRRTVATKLAELQVAPHVVERLLNHKFGSISNKTDGIVSAVAEVYNRYAYLPEMREAISKWESYLCALNEKSQISKLPCAA